MILCTNAINIDTPGFINKQFSTCD